MARTIDETLLPRPPQLLDVPALAPAIRQAAETLPLGRLGTPADIGAGVVYLASEAGAYVTGTVLRIDGGFVLKDAR